MFSPCSDHQIAPQKRTRLLCSGAFEAWRRIGALDEPSARQEYDVAREAPRLPDVVRRHHDLDAASPRSRADVLDGLRGGGIEARGRFVEEQDFGIARERAASASLCCSPPESLAPAVREVREAHLRSIRYALVIARPVSARRRSRPQSAAASRGAGTPSRADRPASRARPTDAPDCGRHENPSLAGGACFCRSRSARAARSARRAERSARSRTTSTAPVRSDAF